MIVTDLPCLTAGDHNNDNKRHLKDIYDTPDLSRKTATLEAYSSKAYIHLVVNSRAI